ncbi:MAG TPA: glutaredoxin family protein [Chloroflexota bacterium]
MRLHIRLYTRPGCHLCEQALVDLERLARRYPHVLEQVDISQDADLSRRYGELIPVLTLNGGPEYAAPLPAAVVERALAEAHRLQTRDDAGRVQSVGTSLVSDPPGDARGASPGGLDCPSEVRGQRAPDAGGAARAD